MSFVGISRSLRAPSTIHDIVSVSLKPRYFSTTKINCYERDAEDAAATSKKDLVAMVSDEKRGIFRVLDIGLPRPYGARKPRRSDRRVIKAIPR